MDIIVDANNLASRFFYAMKPLFHAGTRVEAVLGVLKAARKYIADYNPSGPIIWTFDSAPYHRQTLMPSYKAERKPFMADANRDRKFLHPQMALMRGALSVAGFNNILCVPGFEADDHIASVTRRKGTHLIVSSDQDLYQCLRDNVSILNPATGREYTLNDFTEEFDITPDKWPEVKAIAGCKSDGVPNIPGIGEKNAAAYVAGNLAKHTLAHCKIRRGIKSGILDKNLPLVKLPFAGTPSHKMKEDKLSAKGWGDAFAMVGSAVRA